MHQDPTFTRARSRLYDLLATVFDGDVETLERALRDGAFVQLADGLPADLDTDALRRDDLDADALGVGYDNLFDVPGPHYVPPFASAHATEPSESFESDSSYHSAGEAGELFGDPAHTVAEWYARADFEPERGDGIPDHVAAEFAFMAALTREEAAILESDDADDVAALRDVQREMLDHLAWVEPFAAAVAEKDGSERVFAALSEFALAVVAWDADQLDG